MIRNFLFSIWNRLTEPAASLHNEKDRQRARLFLALLIVFIASVLPAVVKPPGGTSPPTPPFAVLVLILTISYCLSRTKYYVFGVVLTLSALYTLPFVLLIMQANYSPGGVALSLMWVVIPLLMSGVLVSRRATNILAGGLSVTVALLTVFVPGLTFSAVSTVLVFVATWSVFYIILLAHADRLEMDRQAELRQAVKALRQAHDELEMRVQERTKELESANKALHMEIIEREHVEAALEVYAGRLEQSNRELESFAYITSHDLREPLRKVAVFGDRLRSGYGEALDERGLLYLVRMQDAATRMETLIDGLLTYSRVTSKAQPFAPVDLSQVAREVVSDLEVRIEQVDGRVEIANLPSIDADALQMQQLLQNLIGNALKFHREDEPPLVKVHAQLLNGRGDLPVKEGTTAERCRITVTDNGIGFDEKYLDRMFQAFQRLHSRSEFEGTGIGLATCRKIVERHGGEITAQSRPGQGATFIVTLPVRQSKEKGGR
jgi:signal transduction histidine kinase